MSFFSLIKAGDLLVSSLTDFTVVIAKPRGVLSCKCVEFSLGGGVFVVAVWGCLGVVQMAV